MKPRLNNQRGCLLTWGLVAASHPTVLLVLPRIPSQVDTLHLHSVSRSVSVEVPTRTLTFYLFVHLSS